jgi:hypothetical protein
MATTHQPDQAEFRSVLPADIDWELLPSFPPPARLAVGILPGGTSSFHWAKSGEYVTQVTAIGPISLDDVNPQDDPRH